MQREKVIFAIQNNDNLKQLLLNWSQQFNKAIWLDGNNYTQKDSSFDALLAVDEYSSISSDYNNSFEKLKKYQSEVNDYLFGYFSYDLKNDLENLTSSNPDGLNFPELYFFQPKKIIYIKNNQLIFLYPSDLIDSVENDYKQIKIAVKNESATNNKIKIKLRIHKDEYYEKLHSILAHIHRGDIYEVNFCLEFYAENSTINPLDVYQNLNSISASPFATFLKLDNLFLLSASPERYLKKEGNTIISQPIKGTKKRSENIKEDAVLKKDLSMDEKERAENIMIVDLVRNDLSKSAIKGSVKVDELCKVYTFKQVHQLISTISCKIDSKTNPIDIIKDTFPMGSMTGAPKISAMKIIEELEETKRGLYSGAVGYFTPDNNFDFNVIIRSILYNQEKNYISYSVGGAITAKSIPEKEYEECLLKAKAMRSVLESG